MEQVLVYKTSDDYQASSPGPAHAADDDQTPWQSEHEHPIPIPTKLSQSDEDSDDRPIMRTLKRHDRDDSVSVSIHPHSVSPIHCLIVLTLF